MMVGAQLLRERQPPRADDARRSLDERSGVLEPARQVLRPPVAVAASFAAAVQAAATARPLVSVSDGSTRPSTSAAASEQGVVRAARASAVREAVGRLPQPAAIRPATVAMSAASVAPRG
jgi:hypothetical protein